ncbi:inheritance of peroxisomes protein 1-domain-containing protein [Kockiozyma suomiensis]|uniref:inheritance of peroxisomes protein 1-domain-containing protein n=1 Tax=Kockiozyma suomiensis TaxID=1337062 RepID=UPI0033436C44
MQQRFSSPKTPSSSLSTCSSPPSSAPRAEEVLLVHCPRARLVSLTCASSATPSFLSPPLQNSIVNERSVARGPLKIYRIAAHNSTFIQCGSAVHPILKRLRCWQVASNKFILPLPTQGTYFRLEIESTDAELLQILETNLAKSCRLLQSSSSAPLSDKSATWNESRDKFTEILSSENRPSLSSPHDATVSPILLRRANKSFTAVDNEAESSHLSRESMTNRRLVFDKSVLAHQSDPSTKDTESEEHQVYSSPGRESQFLFTTDTDDVSSSADSLSIADSLPSSTVSQGHNNYDDDSNNVDETALHRTATLKASSAPSRATTYAIPDDLVWADMPYNFSDLSCSPYGFERKWKVEFSE